MSSEVVTIARNPRKTTTVRRLGRVDIGPLKDAIASLPEELWEAENAAKPNRQFDALASTRHIVFRFVSSFRDWRQSFDRPLWNEWNPLLQPVLDSATASYGYRRGAFPRVMLARMPSGGAIHPHCDRSPSAQWPHKIHVPLQTNEGVVFHVNGAPYHLEEGEAVELNNMDVHSVENRGRSDRIHLIFEYYDLDQPEPEWFAPLLATPVPQANGDLRCA